MFGDPPSSYGCEPDVPLREAVYVEPQTIPEVKVIDPEARYGHGWEAQALGKLGCAINAEASYYRERAQWKGISQFERKKCNEIFAYLTKVVADVNEERVRQNQLQREVEKQNES